MASEFGVHTEDRGTYWIGEKSSQLQEMQCNPWLHWDPLKQIHLSSGSGSLSKWSLLTYTWHVEQAREASHAPVGWRESLLHMCWVNTVHIYIYKTFLSGSYSKDSASYLQVQFHAYEPGTSRYLPLWPGLGSSSRSDLHTPRSPWAVKPITIYYPVFAFSQWDMLQVDLVACFHLWSIL